jgi:chaperone required for assembly of F1-ATPase
VKRFWKDVTIAGGAILLDGRGVKTPARAPLVLPNVALAEAVADEWREVGETVDPRAMPMTGFANAAIDRVAPDPQAFAADLAKYGETDVLCYRAESTPELVARQAAVWDPMLDWARTRYDIAVAVTAGIVHAPQPAETSSCLATAVAARTPFELAALSPLVTIGGSLVAALMLAEDAIDADAAFDATHLDELWQAELWGEEWTAADARAARRADFVSAARFLSLAGSDS